ncbi:MAG: helix-turn-helix domain-containing protein [Myxococcales bacterium]|nr:helix-turn-helix domain-containing protein [Myxococcales bacterium]
MDAKLPTKTEVCETQSPDYITDVELAERIKVSRVTIQSWRQKGEGAPFYRTGRRIIYDWGEVQNWVREQRVG